MKIFILILLSFVFINSCVSIKNYNTSKVYYEDILDFESNDIEEIKEQINIREKKVTDLTNNIATLNSYTKKISQRSELDYLYGRDNSTIDKYLEDTRKEINKYNIIRTRTLKEIKILERKLKNISK